MSFKVYSIVDNVVRISLIDVTNPLMHKDVLDYLLKVDLVEEIDEGQVSKVGGASFHLDSVQHCSTSHFVITEKSPGPHQQELLHWREKQVV